MPPTHDQVAKVKANGHSGKPTVAGIAKAKQLPAGFLRDLGLADHAYGVGIEYRREDGHLAAVKKRTALVAKEGSFWQKGAPLLAYGLWRLELPRKLGLLYLVEGESDCWALWHHKFPALGIPGANNAKVLTAEALVGITTIYVCKEPGQSGDTFIPCVAAQLRRLKWQGIAKQIQMPEGCKDPADLHCRFPHKDAFAAALRKCLDASTNISVLVQTSALPNRSRAGRNGADNGHETDGVDHSLPEIIVTHRQLQVNNKAIAALALDKEIFARGGRLVEIRQQDTTAQKTQIVPLELPTLSERMAACANWIKEMPSKKGPIPIPTIPPEWSVAAVRSRGEWDGIRPLKGIAEFPVLLPSGEVLTQPGYHEASGIVLAWAGKPLQVPAEPTRAQVARAVAQLEEVIVDFPFAAEECQAAWFAALLTPLARFAFSGPTPLFLVDANTRGSGKSLMVKAIVHVLTGRTPAITSYPRTDDHRRNLITSLALGGELFVVLDNMKGYFGDEILDAVLTSTSWADRMFHTQQRKTMDLQAVWYVTGNNLQIVGDTARRVLPIRLESSDEQPERREGFKHPDLLEWVNAQRPRLLAAALTLLRGYIAAGRPPQQLRPWGSYESWSALVRGALVWAGVPDPRGNRDDEWIAIDDQRAEVAALLECIEQIDGDGHGLTSAEILGEGDVAYHSQLHPRMKAILTTLLGAKNLEPMRVGRLMRQHRDARLGGRVLKMKTIRGENRWIVLRDDRGSPGGGT